MIGGVNECYIHDVYSRRNHVNQSTFMSLLKILGVLQTWDTPPGVVEEEHLSGGEAEVVVGYVYDALVGIN